MNHGKEEESTSARQEVKAGLSPSQEEVTAWARGFETAYQVFVAPGSHRCDCFYCKEGYHKEKSKALSRYISYQAEIRFQESQKWKRTLPNGQGNEPCISQIYEGGS